MHVSEHYSLGTSTDTNFLDRMCEIAISIGIFPFISTWRSCVLHLIPIESEWITSLMNDSIASQNMQIFFSLFFFVRFVTDCARSMDYHQSHGLLTGKNQIKSIMDFIP